MTVRNRQRALTLVELAVTTAALGVVLVSAMHVMNVSRRSAERVYNELAPQIQAMRVAEQMRQELATSISISAAASTGITFMVPDRDSDGSDETIDYAYAANRLTRSYNGASAVTVLDNLPEFSLSYRARIEVQTSESEQEVTAPDNTDLAAWDGYPNGTGTTCLDASLSQTTHGAIHVELRSLPATTVSYDITKVKLRLRKQGLLSTGTLTIRVETPASASRGWPSGTVLDAATLDIGLLDTAYGWRDVFFSNLVNLPPETSSLSFRLIGGTSANMRMESCSPNSAPGPDDGTQYYWSTNSGSSWSPDPPDYQPDARIYVYGRYRATTRVQQDVGVSRITGAQVTLRTTGADRPVIRFASLVNEPAFDLGAPPDDDEGWLVGVIRTVGGALGGLL